MDERRLGNSGLFVSQFALGTMTWGRDTDIYEARDQFNAYLYAGGNLLDTSDVYAGGASEELIGEFGREHPNLTISLKTGAAHGQRRRNTSRAHLLDNLDASLKRLRRSHVDIWQVYGFDEHTTVDETVATLVHALDTGRVRYVGVSNMAGWQSALIASELKSRGHHLVCTQVEYSLLERGIEREVLPFANHYGVGIMAWSPLGRGVLTGKYRFNTPPDSRGASPHFAAFIAPYLTDRARTIVDALALAAQGLSTTPAEVALRWQLSKTQISSSILGARTASQLRALLAIDQSPLPTALVNALDEVSAPNLGYPEAGWNQN